MRASIKKKNINLFCFVEILCKPKLSGFTAVKRNNSTPLPLFAVLKFQESYEEIKEEVWKNFVRKRYNKKHWEATLQARQAWTL